MGKQKTDVEEPIESTVGGISAASGIVAPEFHIDFAKIAVKAGGVKIWGFTDQTNPLEQGTMRIPAVVMSMTTLSFDLFIADCLRIRADMLHGMNGNHTPVLDLRKVG